jgi:DNA polymerase-3 subunit alpha
MKDILNTSYGVLTYQDDVLLIAIALAGYTWEEADKFRKAMGKKIPEEMAKQKEKFFKGAKEFGKLTSETINKLWERIEPFAAYGFNKAHAASYAVVAYQTAYLKANFPVQYMTAVLIAESGDIDKVPEIIHECERMGVKVLPPDINESFKSFAMIAGENGGSAHIRFGLNGIKNLGENIAEAIYQERKANGKFKDLQDFLTRVKDKDLNKKSLESLAKCGALDSFGYDRGMLLANMENILSFSKQIKEGGANTQHSLFSGTSLDAVSVLKLVNAKPANEADKLTWEKELLGFYITSHPFKAYQEIMKDTLIPLKDLSAQPRNQWVVVGGMLDSTKKKITRSGKAMMFAKLLDTTSSLELLVFPKTYETTAAIWVEGRPVCVIGRTSEEEGDDKLFVEKAYVLTKENAATLAKQMSFGKSYETKKEPEPTSFAFEIVVSPEQLKSQAETIKNILSQYPGDEAVVLKVGGKIIRTSYRVSSCEELKNELAVVIQN